MDELNDYLECTCGRCDDGICRCNEWEDVYPQESIIYDEPNCDKCINNLNDLEKSIKNKRYTEN